ncbi:hypothetical protein [Bacillus paramycoides]|uniref:hypothetical protein n=1 Tax=Bacillus paramycoides TaxID=2026194 RepID=UPI002E1F8423|nr:hypothetical protein [Bacillus paramycoides]
MNKFNLSIHSGAFYFGVKKVVLTLNTIDIMTIKVKPDDNMRDTFIVLNSGDKLLIQQETENTVNVMINGTSEIFNRF